MARVGTLSYRIDASRILRWARPIRSLRERRPDKASQFARDGGHGDLMRTPACGEAPIGPVEAMLRRPGLLDHVTWRVALTAREPAANVGRVTIVPRGLHQDASQMRVARLGDVAAT